METILANFRNKCDALAMVLLRPHPLLSRRVSILRARADEDRWDRGRDDVLSLADDALVLLADACSNMYAKDFQETRECYQAAMDLADYATRKTDDARCMRRD